MKKLISILSAIVLLMACIPLGAVSVSAGTYGDLTYTVFGGEVTITDCSSTVYGWVFIPDTIEGYPVTAIGDEAFYDCTSITSVTIPSSIKKIGEDAFESITYAPNFTKVYIQDLAAWCAIDFDEYCNVLDGRALYVDYSKVTELVIPDTVTEIGDYAFSGCTSIETVIIGDSVTDIGNGAFEYCRNLQSVTMGSNVVYVQDYAFYTCESLIDVCLSPATRFIWDFAFAHCTALKNVCVPLSLTTIDRCAFYDCPALTNVIYAGQLADRNAISINSQANDDIKNATWHYNNGLTYTISGQNLTITGVHAAFSGALEIPATIQGYSVTAVGTNAFEKAAITSVSLPESITAIGTDAFWFCDTLASITIPVSVTSIGSDAFYGCSSLTDVYYGGTEADRANMTIGSYNDPLLNATWHYHEHSYDDDYDSDCNECGKTRCIHEYFSACDIVCLICNEVSREAGHNVVHVPAVANTCYTEGNIEYWYCTECGYAWLDEDCTLNTNLKAVILPAAHSDDLNYDPYRHSYRCTICGEVVLSHFIQHVPAVTPTHFTEGNVEYWYCEMCGTYFLDEACTEMVEYGSMIILPESHNIVHVEAKAPNCTELGNIEYWYCTECGYAWLDEDCTLNTNLKAVILPMAEHTFDHAYDTDCNECGNIRTMNAPATFGGNSVSEDVSGLAFRFDVSVVGMKMNRTTAIYDGATIDDYKLIKMGAIVTNRVDTIDIPCVYLWELKSDSCSFAVRLIDIPTDKYDVAITATPYVVLEIDGVATTIYGEAYTASYNDAITE